MNREQYNFSNDFQDLILACWMRHPKHFTKYGLLLDYKLFVGVLATATARVLAKYLLKFSKTPSWSVLRELVDDDMQSVRESSRDEHGVSEYIDKLKEMDTDDVDYVTTKVVEFARERSVIIAIKKSIILLNDGKLADSDGGVVKLVEDALKVGQDVEDMGYVLHLQTDEIIDKVTQYNYGIKTGYPYLDGIWKNGWGPGWLIAILAPPKRYKTLFCINLALNMVGPSIDKTVFYYACEISQELAAVRALSNIAGKDSDYMFEYPEKFKLEVKKELDAKLVNNFMIKGFPSRGVTIAQIKAHAKAAIHYFKFKPSAIIVDYADTVMAADTSQSERSQQASIYTDARAMGKEFGVPIIMPDRCKQETVAMPVPSMTSFQGAFEKAGIVDVAIGVCATDSEYQQNVVRLFVFLNRHGKAYQHFRCHVDPDLWRLAIEKEIEYKPVEETKGRRGRARTTEIPDEMEA